MVKLFLTPEQVSLLAHSLDFYTDAFLHGVVTEASVRSDELLGLLDYIKSEYSLHSDI